MGKEEFSHQIIRASAGSGKTYKLSERYLKLLLEGVPAESILATTFTRKAAGEIQSRILSRLGKGAVSEEGALELSKQLAGDPAAIPRERFQTLVVDVVRSINRLRVCTLDAFFMQLAGGYAFELGLSPGWTIVDDGANQSNLGGAIQSTFAQTNGERAHELSRLLFKGESKRSVESQVFELAVNALEIYGESTKAAWMLLKESAEAADGGLEECMKALEDAELPSNKPKKGADPAPNANFVRARKALMVALADKNWKAVLSNGLVKAAIDGSYTYYKLPIEDSLKDALDAVVDLTANEQNKALGIQLEAIWNVVNAIAHYFDQSKAISGGYRFDDLARKLADFLREKPAAFASNLQQGQTSQIDYRLDAKTRHLLLDEFQDASYKQWQIIRPFAERIAASLNANLDPNDPDYANKLVSFFCVGDMKQAIYGWRGGVAEIFEEIERTLKNVSSRGLDMNWRSCPVVIEVVNKLFGNIKDNPVVADVAAGKKSPADLMKVEAVRAAFMKWQDLFVEHSYSPNNAGKDGFWAIEVAPRVAEERDLVASAQLPVVDPDTEQELEPVDLSYNVAPDDLDASDNDDDANEYQSDSVSQRQKELTISYAARRVRNLRDKYPRATIGVLARSNDYLARILRKLKRLGVDASAEGGATIVDAPAVGAMLAVFRLAAHPGDSVDAFCVANVEPIAQEFGIDPNALDHWACSRVSSYLRACVETEGYGAFAARIRDLLRPLCKGADDKAVRQRERLDQLVEFAYSYQAAVPGSSIDDFVRAAEEYKVQAPSANPVRLMTIHASKGLEFDIVVLPELDGSSNADLADIRRVEFIAGRQEPLAPIEAVVKNVSKEERAALPKNFQNYFGAEIKRTVVEALCLLYVAITRPKRMLLAIVNPEKEKDPKKASSSAAAAKLSFANIIRSGLPTRPGIAGESGLRHYPQRIYGYGDPNWGADLAEPVGEENDAANEQEQDAPVFRRVERKRLLYRRQTPTGGDFDDETGNAGASPYAFWKPREVFIHGRSLHACYEQTEWLDDRIPDDLTLEAVVAPIVAFDKQMMAQEIAKFRRLCSSNFTQLLMSRAAYLEPGTQNALFFQHAPCAVAEASAKCADPRFVVCRERNFNVTLREDLILNGTFDRLVLLYDGDLLVAADVVDFKTDVKAPGDELFAEYLRQLRRYGLAAERMFGLPQEKISLRLAFVSLGRVVNARVDTKPDFNAPTPRY